MDRTLSHYRLEDELGRGGMGIVYRAIDTRLGRPVAIKMLPAEATADEERNRRFVQEARAASALNHPHIVTIHDIDEDAGTTFIAMELVDGTPLDRVIAGGPLPVAQAVEYAVQAASALDAAHAAGIVHRDIKPANIMITRDGRVKVLDFGLAKLIDRDQTGETRTALGTRPGIVMGTAAYMSPEQAEGRPVLAASDIFSFGAVLYEMLTGRRAFAGNSDIGLITAILRDQPPPLRGARPEVPVALQAIVDRCLAKDPLQRYQDAGALRADLVSVHAQLTRPAEAGWRRPRVLLPVAAVLVAIAAFGAWQTVQARRARWVQDEAIPELQRLQTSDRPLAALNRARDLERYAPGDVARVKDTWYGLTLVTSPDGADVQMKDYRDVDGPWLPVGRTPLQDMRLPWGYYRMRITKPGYLPVEIASASLPRPPMTLVPEGDAPPGMVAVPGGPFSVGVAGTVTLADFWIDRLEVTNTEYKKFVDAGGYREARYWKAPFVDGGRTLSFDEAMARFTDATGRTGPAAWDLGTFPDGRGDFPVGGISWFEAAAYAEFAGKSLPTLHQWYRAAPPDELSSDILHLSNFESAGPVRAGERHGLGPWGTLDMAGNVKEWCLNPVRDASLRYILGGSWNEPSYRYSEDDAQNPWSRERTHGVRLVKNLEPAGDAAGPIPRVYGDPDSLVPVSDEVFDSFTRFYDYERSPLRERTDAVDDSSPYWRKETVSFDAAYEGERVPAYLFLPKNATPPYQTVVLFPSGYARAVTSSRTLDLARFDFIVRSGRALLYPVYQGTFERRREMASMSDRRDVHVQWAKDFRRAVEYLGTRRDIDVDRIGYYSLSMGAFFGPIPVALEPKIKAAVFASGGLRFDYPPEIQPANFMPRVRVPVLLINGKDDYQCPPESQQKFLELLGTPPEHKQRVALDGGHVPTDNRGLIRHVLDWFDKYLGRVE
jgi:dienelactone hydrolase/predicted Ser/Thr protein kinase